MHSSRKQSGMTLVVVVLLLLLAGVLSLFALNTGIFEQRASGNDLKAKLVNEVAEAGLSQGMEYLRTNATSLTDSAKWTACAATDTSFPCGSVPAGRRATTYYWASGGHDFDGNGTVSGWEQRMLPLTAAISATGSGFPAEYGVGAVICYVAPKANGSDPTTCTDSGGATSTSVITFVSVAALPGEGARTTLTQTVGSYRLFNNIVDAPPIVASGSINIYGTLQVVANPNAGGTGQPVSLWSPKSATGHGTANTCYANEFFSGGDVDWTHAATLPTMPLCDTCNCDGSLSYVKGNAIAGHGIDILDGTDATSAGGNAAVHVDADQTKTEFPCDLFQKVFGVQAWEDDVPSTGTPPGDGFCETHKLTTFTNPNNTNQVVTMGVDEAFLFKYADYIQMPSTGQMTFPCVSGCAGVLTASALRTSAQTTATQSGLVWCQDGSQCASGTADAPVLVVIDGGTTISGNVYGLVFMRSTDVTSGYVAGAVKSAPISGVDFDTGGNATFAMHGNNTIYGSVVVQGTTGHINGTSAVVSHKDILTVLNNGLGGTKFGGVPGAWSDRTSY